MPLLPRFFNTAGPCRTEKHYMLPPEHRLGDLRPLIQEEAYFVVHAPRQSGKTTSFQHLARSLTAEGRFAALLASCETGRTARNDTETGISAVIRAIDYEASIELPEELRPPSPEASASIEAESRLMSYLRRWCEQCPRPVVLFLDEIDALFGKTLLSVLHQLRSGYRGRPEHFPQSMVLIGLRDVRDYRLRDPSEGGDSSGHRELTQLFGTSSPFNIKVESLTLRDFTAEEVAELYEQHTMETGQVFSQEAEQLAWGLTRGQPWLVNALARQAVRLLEDFVAFWREHAESFLKRQPYSEAAAQLILMAWLQKVVNGGGTIDREYAAGSGRIDLCVRWPLARDVQERFALELKVWRGGQADPRDRGLEQLGAYLDRLGLDSGTLVLFDQRPDAAPFATRGGREVATHAGFQILVLRL